MNEPPLITLARETVSIRRLLFNRFTILIAVILIGAVAWQGFVAANNGGTISGQVVDADGDPVSNATVTLSPQTVASVPNQKTATTDANGEFTFEDDTHLEFTIRATHPDLGESDTKRFHRYFKGEEQSVTVVIDG